MALFCIGLTDMPQDTSSSPRLEGSTTRSGISLRALFLLALFPTILVLGGLLYMVTSRQADIREEGQRMLWTSLPLHMEQQRTSVNLERLRLLGNIVYMTIDPIARRKARIEAQALTTDAAFESVPNTRLALEQAYEELENLARARDIQRGMRIQMYETVGRIENLHSQLLIAAMQLPKAQGLVQLTNFSTTFLELLNVLDVRNVTAGEENVVIIIDKIASLEATARGAGVPESILTNYYRLEQQSYQFLRLYKEYFAAEKTITNAWQEFDVALRSLSDRISVNAAQGIESMLQNSIALAVGVERITWQGFMLLCATLIMGLFIIRNFVGVPVVWLIHAIDAIRDGSEPQPEPRIFIYELQRLSNALVKLNSHWSLVKAHSQQLETERHVLEGLSIKDGLTDLYNRRYFDIQLNAIWQESIAEGSPVALLMMDIDHFKNYNDNLGHPKGDVCLQRLAQSFSEKILRPTDKVCRYGGEEFALLLYSPSPGGALRLAARIHDGVRLLMLHHPASSVSDFVTLSIGVVTHSPTEGDAPHMLVEWADRALYAAKNAGRNRTFQCILSKNADGTWSETLQEVGHGNDTLA